MAAPTLNGTTFYPSSIDEDGDKVGAEIQAADGSQRFAHRANKKRWTLTWKTVPLATLTAVRAIYALTSTFTFVDEQGNSYTVFCPPGALQSTAGAFLATENGVQVIYYDIALRLVQT